MASDSSSPPRNENESTSRSNGPYANSYTNNIANSNTSRINTTTESSQYQTNNSEITNSEPYAQRKSSVASSSNLPLSQSPNIAGQSTTTPSYSRPRTPVAEAAGLQSGGMSDGLPSVSVPPTIPALAPPQPPSIAPTNSNSNSIANADASNGYRPLNVKDALTYLDKVKVKFADQPEVYSRFLDIMKEFKSQAIDTPGVIERVSTLFRGHPALISGFNTFLPPGYRIECTTDAHSRDIIKVTTPSGTTSTTSGEPLNLQSEVTETNNRYYSAPHTNQQKQPIRSSGSYNNYRNSISGPPLPPVSSYHPPSQQQQSQTSLPAVATASRQQQQPIQQRSHSRSPSEENGTRKAPVEFNHAINYVNKIKNRFSNDPDTYKQFLEILQTYQKEQKPIQEVYAQVQILFNGANDLLAEFKQFLPDTSQQQQQSTSEMYATANTTQQAASKKLKKRTLAGIPTKQKRTKLQHSKESNQQQQQSYHLSDVRGNRSPILIPGTPEGPVISTIEVDFFERVKKYIGNKSVYHSFLRVLNLFSQQILDQNSLIQRCESYLGGQKELYDQLKKLVGYDGKDTIIENIPVLQKPDFSICQMYGPSYRSVPKSWQNTSCSGRDSLCLEVLNDEYVSHPTWASENSGFLASKKNVFEEALHRIEEERYEYDLNIEANLNTISLLEPISKKIANMSEEEVKLFKLPPGLGGPSKTIYQRVIKKIYGKEQGREIIDMLHSHPSQTVPLILKRMKQMDEEWKKAQREWNKVWREVEIRNYYKALDYQGVVFKNADRRAMSVKSLVSEIEAIHLDQLSQPHYRSSNPQFVFNFKSKKIFQDVTRVLCSYFEKQTIYGHEDCKVMKAFVEMFLPIFFDVPNVLPQQEQAPAQTEVIMEEATADEEESDEDEVIDDEVNEDDEDTETQTSYDSTDRPSRRSGSNPYSSRNNSSSSGARNGRRSPRHKPSDEDQRLLKDVLKRNVKPDYKFVEEEKAAAKEKIRFDESDEEGEETSLNKEQKIYNVFGNTTFYCFFRLFQMCYDRLYKMNQVDREYMRHPERTKLMSKASLELNITSATFNSIEMDFKDGYYNALLKLIDRFFDEELDQHIFEECCRYIFGTKAYSIFTIDKLMLSIMRQLHSIVTEPKAQELLSSFKKHHEHENISPSLIQAYRLEVTEALEFEDHLYNLAFDTSNRTLCIQLLETDKDETFELNDMNVYNEYAANYMDWNQDTPGVNQKMMSNRFLKRNLFPAYHDDCSDITINHSGLQYKICSNTYHLFYVIGTEDVFVRKPFMTREKQNNNGNVFKSWTDKKVNSSTDLDDKVRLLFT